MDSRKIQQVGERSFAVSLPKQWIEENDLKKHDSLFMNITADNNLLIQKINREKKAPKNIDLWVDSSDTLLEFIVCCYEKNIDKIKIHSKNLTPKMEGIIRTAVKDLDGYQIVQEDDTSVEIAFLFKDINITLPKIIMRILHLLKLHISSLESRDWPLLRDAEQSVDMLYHLSTRIIFSCFQDHTLRVENELRTDEDIIYTSSILKNMESVSDHIYQLSGRKCSPEDIALLKWLIDFLGKSLGSKAHFSSLKEEILGLKPHSKNKEIEMGLIRVYDLCKEIFEMKMYSELNKKIKGDFINRI
ncbi:MAG: AbrB/MazE/SpoVT family DNA-binding domain-containing protein [Candidatus Nanoarchaeia archaeon]